MKWLKLDWNSETIKVPVQKIKGKLWFHLEGETHSIDVDSGRRKGGQNQAAASGEIKAPMPGKILKVFIENDEKVKAGQSLIAMEAMKMEYTLEADMAGVATGLKVKVGDQVSLGDLLIKIKGDT